MRWTIRTDSTRRCAWAIGAAIAASMGAAGAQPPPATPATSPAHAHQHGHAGDPAAVVPERGWATDAPLRQSMQAIRDALAASVRDAGEGTALAAELRRQVDYMIAHCRLEPAADAALHGIIAELLQSAARLDAGATPAQEHDALHAALVRYGREFDHPGWTPR